MIERNIDCRKHRKSTHLAAADIDSMTLEGKSLIFEIEDARYETGVDVSGKKTDGYFAKLKGSKKEWMVNSKNRTRIAGFAKNNGFPDEQGYNIGNWKGLMIELFVDRNVSMMGTIVDGIRVMPLQPKAKVKPSFTEDNFEKAKTAKATIDQIKKAYSITNEIEKQYNDYVTKD